MIRKTKVLQIGTEDWSSILSTSHYQDLEWYFLNIENYEQNLSDFSNKMNNKGTFDVVICTDTVYEKVFKYISPLTEAYSLIIDQNFESEVPDYIVDTKCPIFMDLVNKPDVLNILCLYFFYGQSGSKLATNSIVIPDSFKGEVTLYGQHRLMLSGDFSDTENNLSLTWQDSMIIDGRSQKIWLEYIHSEHVSLTMTIIGISVHNGEILKKWHYSEQDIKNGVEVKKEEGLSYLDVSLSVSGNGWIQLGSLHYRHSRNIYGEFLLGGKKISDYQNEEIFYYFNPGDFKPPLNIYFSGYRSLEGFEGFNMMKNLGAPFLLIADPRLEGGSFYLGSKELEQKLCSIIKKYMKSLNLTKDEIIFSGLSMGTFGALYYSSYFSPHALILGKPLVNLGTVAINEKINRPGGFPTSLDLLLSLEGSLSEHSGMELNQRFWSTFKQGSFDNTRFIISYMEDDDYDIQAYKNILEYLSSKNSIVIGKGSVGRHNDNWSGIFEWFLKHYEQILLDDFDRKR